MKKACCLNGVCVDENNIKTVAEILEGSYKSKHKCLIHEHCLCIPHTWPTAIITTSWANVNRLRDPLMLNATKCKFCDAQGTLMCVYGKHMVCINHVENWNIDGNHEFMSQYMCLCTEESSLVWPNPFAYAYLHPGGTVLDHGKGAFTDNILHNVAGKSVRIWNHPHDYYPTEQLNLSSNLSLTAWRVQIFDPFDYMYSSQPFIKKTSCELFWLFDRQLNTVRLKVLDKICVLKRDGWQINMHPTFLFMFAVKGADVQSVCCNKKFASLELFAQSSCCLYSLLEFHTFIKA